ncbi:hypothetical protein SCP_0905630 [Sparassis crispa]|uniref:F-box domain-containing protein n=1 Tax=Sparassis crispa TaxID=139825 RepID=A0A401GWX5_9APHY|nr:hypothetical protein SCP_0905630 [Sparassis crispa]GBE86683.1 hypothetical protein SCP_0905630 [Sparassis crispa]
MSLFADATEHKFIEDQILTHTRAIWDLKFRLNMLVPICRLPLETLAAIFLEILAEAEEEQNRLHPYYSSKRAYSWIKVSHVCRRWRSVALECPRFWSHIVLTSPKCVKELLSRSRGAMLSVMADVSTGDVRGKTDALTLLFENFSRIQQLRLIIPQSSLQNIMELMTGPAPVLHTFIITQAGPHTHHLPETRYPAFLYHDETRRLQHFEIRGHIATGWSLPMFPHSLRHLHLSRGDVVPPSPMSDVLKILETTPLLETLKLERVVSGVLETGQVIDLPHLRSMRLVAGCKHSAFLLNHLSFPQDVTISLKSETYSRPGDVAVVASAIAAKISGSDQLRTLSIGPQHSDDSLTIRVCDTLRSLESFEVSLGNGVGRLDLTFNLRLAEAADVIGTFCKHCPLVQVQNLSLLSTDLAMASQTLWVKAFGKLENVSLLQVGGELAQHLPLALGIREEDGNVIVFPKLQELQLNEVWIGAFDGDVSPFMDSFLDSLIQRCDHGVEVRRLVLTKCINTDMTEVALMSEIVPSVTWDGIENFVEDASLAEYEEEEDDDGDELGGGFFWPVP